MAEGAGRVAPQDGGTDPETKPQDNRTCPIATHGKGDSKGLPIPSLFNVKAWSLGDVIGGATVASTSLPQYVAYAELAGLAGHQGLKTSGPPIVAFAFVTSAPSLCVGVTSISALMSFSILNGADYIEKYGDGRWQDLLGAWAALVGIASFVLGLCGASKLFQFIPRSVKQGWKLGFAITVVAAQTAGAVFNKASMVKELCALPSLTTGGPPISGGAAAMYRLGWMLVNPQIWDVGPVALTALTFMILTCSKLLQRIIAVPGIEVVIACVVGTAMAVQFQYTGSVVGISPAAPATQIADDVSLARILTSWVRQWPWDMPWDELFACFGGVHVAVVSAIAFAAVDFLAILSVVPAGPTSELLGQGVACVVSGMLGSAPIGGSLSRSLVAEMTGCTSPLMGLVAGITTLILAFPQIGMLVAPMPKSVLAAVVLAAVLPGVLRPKDVLKLRGADAITCWATAIACCASDPTVGFGVGLMVHAAWVSINSLFKKNVRTD